MFFRDCPPARELVGYAYTVVSLAIFTLLFTAIYKVLPDTAIPSRDH
jgi:membrane protein